MDFQWVEEQDGQFYAPSQPKRKYQPRKKEFVGWGSSNLIEFLKSIGKETRDQISLQDVGNIIAGHINTYKLNHPTKKKRVVCDEKLHCLFGRKTISRLQINELLSKHYAENQEPSDEEFWSSGEDAAPVKVSRPLPPKKLQKKMVETPKSSFAAVIPENVKLVYLKRSLVQELVKDFATFEHKVVGSFVRIKSDPNDYLQKLPYQLIQVTGVKKVSDTDDVLLQVPARDTEISLLSDDSFTEEECAELRQKVKDGLHEKLTVIELEEKARVLHEDITKHWISREIESLKARIDRANEKGWRKELAEYLERSKMLQSEDGKERLLRDVPKVTAEQVKFDLVMKDYLDDKIKIDDDGHSSPEQPPQENQEITRAAMNNPAEVNSPSDDEFYDYLSSPERSNFETVRPEPNGAARDSGIGSAEQWNGHHAEQDKIDTVEKDSTSREKPATIQVEQRRVDHSSNGPQMIDFSSTNSSEHWRGTEIEEQKHKQERNQISRDHHDIMDLKRGLQSDSTVKKPQMMTFSSVSSQLATSNPLAKVVTDKGIAKTPRVSNFNCIEQEITRFNAASNLAPSTGTSYAGAQVQEQHKQPLQRNSSLDLAKNSQESVEKKRAPAPTFISGAQVQEQHKQPLQRDLSLDLAKNNQESVEKKRAPAEVIDLISDDEEEETIVPSATQTNQNPTPTPTLDLRTQMWYYMDPEGKTRGPFPLEQLNQWRGYFPPGFKVWMNHNPVQFFLLTDVLRYAFGW